ncbi:MAG: methyltransferase domain-containing protein [Nitriliruptorales bacterium]|nr:methyltransferase domain-containing protein [Nitriliruptorales bacterium]
MSKTSVSHPIFARVYARLSPMMDRGGVAEHRQRLLAGLTGRVIEVGAGNGLNFAHYPPEVTSVLAVEPEPHLRQIAQGEAERASVPVEVVDGVAERLPVGDATFDAAVASLMLCSVPDQQVALGELHRVIRPGGELRFLEHVRAETPALERVQRLLDATIWPILGGGCHAGRDTAAAIQAAGFAISRLDRFIFPEGRVPFPTSPHILGVASRPAEGGDA